MNLHLLPTSFAAVFSLDLQASSNPLKGVMQANLGEDALCNFRAQGYPQQGPSVHDLRGQNTENSGD
jgi:hypothetical protein